MSKKQEYISKNVIINKNEIEKTIYLVELKKMKLKEKIKICLYLLFSRNF